VTEAEARQRLEILHQEVEDQVAVVTAALPGPLACRRGCDDCCVDDLTVFGVEADLIRYHYADLLASAAPRAVGACAFLDSTGACRVYDHRPYVCRTQGLPLSWQDVDADGAEVQMRDICPLNEEPLGLPLPELKPAQCWALGAFEGRLASLQAEAQNSFELQRESLRGLFTP
jgi:hypothetical protein